MYFITQMTAEQVSAPYSSTLGLVIVVGFIAATTIGSIAWYNSKRPLGWEDKERPDVVPEVDTDQVNN